MMEFNDQVTFVDYPGELERRELEVLIKLVPFVERDVEERCAALEEDAQAMVALMEGMKDDNPGVYYAQKDEVFAECERMKGRENERVVRLRRGIIERAGRVFPELKAADAADVRWTMYDGRCGSEAPTAQEVFRPVSAGAEPSFDAADKERDAQCVFSGEGDGCPSGRAKG